MQRSGILLLSALAYYACGKLGIFLAIPPGYATAVWPSSGIALALALRFGVQALPGIWLGSFLINASISDTFANPSASSLLIPSIIALGAVLQATLGQQLVRRYLGELWSNVRAILYILLLGGPVSCLLAATVGVTTLWTFDRISASQMTDSWLTWWIGDTLGVLAFTPALLAVIVQPGSITLNKRITIIVPLFIMFLLVTAAYVFVRDLEQQQRNEHVMNALSEIRYRVELELDNTLEIVEVLSSYFSQKDTPTRQAFALLTDHYLHHHPSIQALEWAPLVADEQRTAYETAQQRMSDSSFEITERGPNNQMVRASQRPSYFPVTYVTPLTGNEAVVGFDLDSDEIRRRWIDKARQYRSLMISEPVRLVQLQEERQGYLMLKPVFGPSDDTHNPEQLKGFMLLVFVMDSLIVGTNTNSSTTSPHLHLRVFDSTNVVQPKPIMQDDAGLTDYRQQQFLTLANRTWQMELAPSAEFLRAIPYWQSYAVLFAGWPFITLLGVLLIMLVGRQIVIEQKVEEKTEALEKATRQAQQASRAKSDFLANMSHELRTPLNSIIGFTHQVLTKKKDQLDARSVDSLSIVERNARHLLQLINDLLDISKIEAGKFELNPATFDVPELCQDVIKPFAQQARQKRLALVVDCPDALSLTADRLRIYQALLNLVANALRFTQQGRVELHVKREIRNDIPGVRFDVSDTGIGIPAEQQGLLFNKFVQLGESRQAGSGTGLGLALAKEISTLHQGDITVHSEMGQGSTFSLWIPDGSTPPATL